MPCGGSDMSQSTAGADHVPGLLRACLPASVSFTTRSLSLSVPAETLLLSWPLPLTRGRGWWA